MFCDEGCLCIIGAVMLGFAIGAIYGPQYGVLALGCSFIGVSLLWRILAILAPNAGMAEDED